MLDQTWDSEGVSGCPVSPEEREKGIIICQLTRPNVLIPNYAEMGNKVDLNSIFYELQEPVLLLDFLVFVNTVADRMGLHI